MPPVPPAFGARILLIEQLELGGTCINRGCEPKKLLGDAAWLRRKLAASTVEPDLPAVTYGQLHRAI